MFNFIRRALLLFWIPFAAHAQVTSQSPAFLGTLADSGVRGATLSWLAAEPSKTNFLRINVAQLSTRNSAKAHIGPWRNNVVAGNAPFKLAQANDSSISFAQEKLSGVVLQSFVGMPAWTELDVPLLPGSYRVSVQAAAMPGCAAPEIKILVNGMPLGVAFFPTEDAAIYLSTESFDVVAESVNVVRIESAADSDGCVVNIDDLKLNEQPGIVTGSATPRAGKQGSVAGLTLAATVPGKTTIGTATRGNASATATFTAPTSDGGSPITLYTATSTPGTKTGTCAAPCTSITVTGLTNGTAYTFKVKATNAIGTGAISNASNSVTPLATLPGAPTIGTATAGNAQATITFTATAVTGGSAISTTPPHRGLVTKRARVPHRVHPSR